jgi:hypothetical protein
MTAHAHRTLFHPFDREARLRRRSAAEEVADHAPEVLLALAAVLVVLAGPVARAFAPDNAWVAAGSSILLGLGILLAIMATRQLLRGPTR